MDYSIDKRDFRLRFSHDMLGLYSAPAGGRVKALCCLAGPPLTQIGQHVRNFQWIGWYRRLCLVCIRYLHTCVEERVVLSVILLAKLVDISCKRCSLLFELCERDGGCKTLSR